MRSHADAKVKQNEVGAVDVDLQGLGLGARRRKQALHAGRALFCLPRFAISPCVQAGAFPHSLLGRTNRQEL